MQILATLVGMSVGLGLIVSWMSAPPDVRLALTMLLFVLVVAASAWLVIAAARHERQFRAIIRDMQPDLDEAEVRQRARAMMQATRKERF